MGTLHETFLAALATYGIVTLIAYYDGPFDVFKILRGDDTDYDKSKFLSCSVCLTPYVAAFIVIFAHMSFLQLLGVIGLTVFMARIE